MAYTREQLLTGAEKAKQAGDMAAAQELLSMADSLQPEAEETKKAGGYTLDQLRTAIEAAITDNNYEAAKELSNLAKTTFGEDEGPDISAGAAYWNAAKAGLIQAASNTAGVMNALSSNVGVRGTLPSLIAATMDGSGAIERFTTAQKEVEGQLAELTDTDPTMRARKNASFLEQITLAGTREVFDPTNYFGALGLKLLPRGFQAFSFGTSAEFGGEIGEQAEETFFGTDTGIGRTIGALKGGLTTAVATPTVKRAVLGGADVANQVWKKYRTVKTNPKETVDGYATGAAKNLLEMATKDVTEEGLAQTVSDFERIAKIVGRENFPLLVSMSDNPTLRSQVVRLAKTNSSFRTKVKDELTQLSLAIDARAKDLFGSRYAVANIKLAPEVAEEQIKRQERMQNIDEKLEQLGERFIPTGAKSDVGFAIRTLVDAKKKIAKKELSQNYEALMEEAKKNGIRMPKGAVRDVYNFIKQNQIRDIFGKGTPLDKQILKHWSPKESLANDFAPASFEQVESLKRAINKELRRSTPGSDSHRKISQLLEIFEQARTQIKGKYSQRLADIDRLYYERVGINFSAQGIKDMDSQKYAEKIAPILLQNKESLDDFLRVAGVEGVDIAKNAMYMKIYNTAFSDTGLLDRRKLLSFQKKNKELIDGLNMNDEILSVLTDQSTLQLRKASLDNIVKAKEVELSKNIFLKNETTGIDYNKRVKEMLANSDNIEPFFKQLSDLTPEGQRLIKDAARREFIEIARKEGVSMVDFVTDPSNGVLVSRLFGPQYKQDVLDIAKLSDALKTASIDQLSAVVTKEELDLVRRFLPGVDVPYVTSQVRDRISSTTQKVVRILSRFQVAKAQGAVDDKIAELLLDPKGLSKIKNAAVKFDFKLKNPEAFKNISSAYADALPLYFYISTKTGLTPQDE